MEERTLDRDGCVLLRRRGCIAEVVFNRPDALNALPMDAEDAVYRAFVELADDDAVKIVVLRGEGRAFSTGGDVAWLGQQYDSPRVDPEERPRRPSQRRRLARDEKSARTFEAILNSNKVVIGEGKGYILGAALDWFLAADILICAEGTILGHPPARMIAHTGFSTAYWMMRMGPALHAEICLMGRYVSAEEALKRNLLNRVVPADALEATVAAACDAISQLPADGLAIAKFNRRLAYESMGIGVSMMQSSMAHAMQVQQRIEDDEWHINRERKEHGVKGAFKRRDDRFREAFDRYTGADHRGHDGR